MNRHTPKPWTVRAYKDRGFAIDFNEDQEQVVDFVYEEADAHLIAAAPELLEVARAAALFAKGEALPTRQQLLESAQKAIAKARGEA